MWGCRCGRSRCVEIAELLSGAVTPQSTHHAYHSTSTPV